MSPSLSGQPVIWAEVVFRHLELVKLPPSGDPSVCGLGSEFRVQPVLRSAWLFLSVGLSPVSPSSCL